MTSPLEGREIVVAGGAGGLGEATTRLLAAEGARLTVSYLNNRARAEALAGIAGIVQADLRSAADRTRLLDDAPSLYGLVVFTGAPARGATTLAESFAVNCEGPLLLAREAAARMKETATPGAIVLISTMQVVGIFAGSTNYAVPKAALLHGMRILARECRGAANIRVNAICPGVMAAGMALESIQAGKYARFVDEGVIPRYGAAADVARAVRFLLEPDNYITGQALSVDGGMTA